MTVRLRHIAFGSLRRRAGKAALVVVGLSVAVAAFILVLSLVLSLRSSLDGRLTRYGSNLIVTPVRDDLTLTYGGMVIAGAGTGRVQTFHEADLAAVRRVPSGARIAALVPVLLQPVTVEGREFLAMGTDITQSLKVKPWWRFEGWPPRGGAEVLLGLNVRNALDLQVGDVIEVAGHRVTVAGVLWEIGGEEDNLVIMDRKVLAAWSGRVGEINLIEVTAADIAAVGPLSAEIERAVPSASVISVKKSIEFTNRANTALQKFGLAITLLIVAVSGLVVMVTMLSMVKERRREIGVFRAVGYKQRHIAELVLVETAALSAVAAVVGVILGVVGGWAVPAIAPGLDVGAALHPQVVSGGVVVSFVVGLLAALYPAWRAAQMDPAAALKHI